NTEVLTNELVEKIEKAGARIVKREYWGVRPLAYSIQKRNRGHYALLVTDGPAEVAKLIDEALRLDERMLRFLTTSITELSDEPSPLLRRRAPAAAATEEASEATTEEAKTEEAPVAKAEEATEVKAEAKTEEAKTEEAPAAKAEEAPKVKAKAKAKEAPKEESGETAA
ncbi:MAG: 30S ribosomal protein S6, partial [Ghiorsea sp.]